MRATIQDPLDAGLIRAGMTSAALAKLGQLTLMQETDSTNSAVMRMPGNRQHAHAVLAELQTGGRGRRQRAWYSPPGGNVYLSLGWRFRNVEGQISTLPLVAAIAVCGALDRAGLRGHGIKWPNDILFGGKKLAGILVELQSAGSGPALAVIGIGLNVRMPSLGEGQQPVPIDRPWTDLATALDSDGAPIDRNNLAALLLEELLNALEEFESNGFRQFLKAWPKLDLLQGRTIQLERDGGSLTGVACGVDQNGGLLLETQESGLQAIHSGEVSVRYDQ